jgi:hypothetical protein
MAYHDYGGVVGLLLLFGGEEKASDSRFSLKRRP